MRLKQFAVISTMMLLPLSNLLAADGATLAKKCQACHGVNYDQHAMGESPDISEYSAKKLISELREIREETPDDANERLMKEQIKGFSDADIKAVAEYIAGHTKSPQTDHGQKTMPGNMPPKKEKPCGM